MNYSFYLIALQKVFYNGGRRIERMDKDKGAESRVIRWQGNRDSQKCIFKLKHLILIIHNYKISEDERASNGRIKQGKDGKRPSWYSRQKCNRCSNSFKWWEVGRKTSNLRTWIDRTFEPESTDSCEDQTPTIITSLKIRSSESRTKEKSVLLPTESTISNGLGTATANND
jgi:hypothetical protein